VSQKNVPPLACYNFNTHEWILIFLAEMLPIKQAIKRRFTTPPQVTCASALPGKVWKRKITFSLSWIVFHTMHLRAVFLKEKVVICDVFDSV